MKIRIRNYQYGAYSLAQGDAAQADLEALIGGAWQRIGWIDIEPGKQVSSGLTTSGDRYVVSEITVELFDQTLSPRQPIKVDLWAPNAPQKRGRDVWGCYRRFWSDDRLYTPAQAKAKIKARVGNVIAEALAAGHTVETAAQPVFERAHNG